jgi:hypothetical protein
VDFCREQDRQGGREEWGEEYEAAGGLSAEERGGVSLVRVLCGGNVMVVMLCIYCDLSCSEREVHVTR